MQPNCPPAIFAPGSAAAVPANALALAYIEQGARVENRRLFEIGVGDVETPVAINTKNDDILPKAKQILPWNPLVAGKTYSLRYDLTCEQTSGPARLSFATTAAVSLPTSIGEVKELRDRGDARVALGVELSSEALAYAGLARVTFSWDAASWRASSKPPTTPVSPPIPCFAKPSARTWSGPSAT